MTFAGQRSVTEVVDLIAGRVRDPAESLRQARDKIRKRLLYAAKAGELAGGLTGRFEARAIAAWAQVKWPGRFDDLPAQYTLESGDDLGVTDTATATVTSNNLERCKQLLAEAEAEIARLQAELARANSESAALRPLADRYQQIKATNRASASKPRKRR